MTKEKKNTAIRRGLLVSKTLIYRSLLKQVGGFMSNPKRVQQLMADGIHKLKSNKKRKHLTTEVMASFILLTDLVRDYFKGSYQIEVKKVLMMVGVIFYFVTPLDVIPDVLPFLGFLDDVSLIAWLFYALREELQLYITWRNVQVNSTDNVTYEEIYNLAQAHDVPGRSNLSKQDLVKAIRSQETGATQN